MPEEQEGEEYELIPLSPIRRLEKRMEKAEASSGIDIKDFFREWVSIVRMNQSIVDELAKADDALRIEISKLPGKLEELNTNLRELISFIKASAKEEVSAVSTESFKPLAERMDRLIDANKRIVESNEAMASALEEMSKRLARPPLMPPRRPLMRPPR